VVEKWVTSSILLNWSKGRCLPVDVEMFGDAIHNSLRRLGVREDAHRACPPPHLSKRPLQDVGGADGLPERLREAEVVKTMEQVLLQTAHGRFRLVEPRRPPRLKSPDGLRSRRGVEDQLRLAHAGRKRHFLRRTGSTEALVERPVITYQEWDQRWWLRIEWW
jgi:hypothetical protein